MYFLRISGLILLLAVLVNILVSSTVSFPISELKSLLLNSQKLQAEVEKVFRTSKKNCSHTSDKEYDKVIADFLNQKFTDLHKNQTDGGGAMSKIKNKIFSVFQPPRSQNSSELRLKRC